MGRTICINKTSNLFGLKNVLMKFQRVMNEVLVSLKFSKCYIDNIIVFSHSYHFKCEHHFINITLMASLYLVIGIIVSVNTMLYCGAISLSSLNHLCVGRFFKCNINSSEIKISHY
jgi:hypothetical protein